MDIDQIRALKQYYTDQLYSVVRKEQTTDDGYYKDNFEVPQLEESVPKSRTGSGAQIIDMPVEQIAAMVPVASRKPEKDTEIAKLAANRVTSLINEKWLDKIGRQGLIKEFIKNQLLRGEAWIHPLHNESWVLPPKRKTGLPVIFLIPDPMVLFASPNENEDGVPENVVVFYERQPSVIQAKYPAWSNPRMAGAPKKKSTVTWIEYWSSKERYFEADDEPVLKGKVQENIYGLVPFIHKNAGFGKLFTPDGKMEDVIVGRLRRERDLLQRECAITSDVDFVIHTFANRSVDVQPMDDNHKIPPDFRDKYEIGTGLVHELPPGITVTRAEEMLPEDQLFNYLYTLKADVGRITPQALTGTPAGATGRLQDMAYTTAMKRYEGIVKNTEYAFATAFGMALEIIEKLDIEVDGLNSGDINKYYDVTVQLKPDDPLEEDRKSTLGDRLWNQGNGCIDLRTNLVKYQGYSQEDAEEIIADILVDKLTLYNPDVASVMGMVFAEESGMARWIEEAKQKQAMKAESQQALQSAPPATTQERVGGEVKAPLGKEMMDMALANRGARASPARYTRGT